MDFVDGLVTKVRHDDVVFSFEFPEDTRQVVRVDKETGQTSVPELSTEELLLLEDVGVTCLQSTEQKMYNKSEHHRVFAEELL